MINVTIFEASATEEELLKLVGKHLAENFSFTRERNGTYVLLEKDVNRTFRLCIGKNAVWIENAGTGIISALLRLRRIPFAASSSFYDEWSSAVQAFYNKERP